MKNYPAVGLILLLLFFASGLDAREQILNPKITDYEIEFLRALDDHSTLYYYQTRRPPAYPGDQPKVWSEDIAKLDVVNGDEYHVEYQSGSIKFLHKKANGRDEGIIWKENGEIEQIFVLKVLKKKQIGRRTVLPHQVKKQVEEALAFRKDVHRQFKEIFLQAEFSPGYYNNSH